MRRTAIHSTSTDRPRTFSFLAGVLSLLTVVPFLAATAIASPEEDEEGTVSVATSLPPVRVRLASLGTPNTLTVRGTGALKVVDTASGALMAARTPSVTLTAEGSEIAVAGGEPDAVAETPGGARRGTALRIEGAMLLLGVGRGQRIYPGALLVSATGGRLSLVNECPLEEYTVGVLAGECPALFHPDAIRAMAVAARSYSYRRAYLSGQELCDTTHCQVYRGVGTSRTAHRDAVRDTAGLCALHNGEVIDAVYCSDCGGRTEASEDAWKGGKPVPYLRSVEDAPEAGGEPFCAVNRSHRWTLALPKTRLQTLMGAAGPLKLEVTETTTSGRARRLALSRLSQSADAMGGAIAASAKREAKEFTGEQWRRMVGATAVKSLKFAVQETAAGVELNGTGFGHGVGLCQFGANGMGRRGYSFRDILTHYYTGVTIAPAPPVDATAPRRPATTQKPGRSRR
jgi:stage II sporulation protein D